MNSSKIGHKTSVFNGSVCTGGLLQVTLHTDGRNFTVQLSRSDLRPLW